LAPRAGAQLGEMCPSLGPRRFAPAESFGSHFPGVPACVSPQNRQRTSSLLQKAPIVLAEYVSAPPRSSLLGRSSGAPSGGFRYPHF
jgi:hypothetical protein